MLSENMNYCDNTGNPDGDKERDGNVTTGVLDRTKMSDHETEVSVGTRVSHGTHNSDVTKVKEYMCEAEGSVEPVGSRRTRVAHETSVPYGADPSDETRVKTYTGVSDETRVSQETRPTHETNRSAGCANSQISEREVNLPAIKDLPFRTFLWHFKAAMEDEDLQCFKFLTEGLIRAGVTESLDTADKYFRHLMQLGFLSVNNIIFLQVLAFCRNRPDLSSMLKKFGERHRNIARLHICDPNPDPVEGFRNVRFHLTAEHLSQNKVDEIRFKLADMLDVSPLNIVVTGIQTTGSWYITFMIPDTCSENLLTLVKRQENWFLERDVDELTVGHETLYISGDASHNHSPDISLNTEAELSDRVKTNRILKQLIEQTKVKESRQEPLHTEILAEERDGARALSYTTKRGEHISAASTTGGAPEVSQPQLLVPPSPPRPAMRVGDLHDRQAMPMRAEKELDYCFGLPERRSRWEPLPMNILEEEREEARAGSYTTNRVKHKWRASRRPGGPPGDVPHLLDHPRPTSSRYMPMAGRPVVSLLEQEIDVEIYDDASSGSTDVECCYVPTESGRKSLFMNILAEKREARSYTTSRVEHRWPASTTVGAPEVSRPQLLVTPPTAMAGMRESDNPPLVRQFHRLTVRDPFSESSESVLESQALVTGHVPEMSPIFDPPPGVSQFLPESQPSTTSHPGIQDYSSSIYYKERPERPAGELLRQLNQEGVFLMRDSKGGETKVLEVFADNKPKRYRILHTQKNTYYLETSKHFDSIEDLISYYQRNKLPLGVCLKTPYFQHPKYTP